MPATPHIKKALTRVLRPFLGTPAESFLTVIRLAVRNLGMKSILAEVTRDDLSDGSPGS
jgi:hypothetical protein